jgi:hypothetical protein
MCVHTSVIFSQNEKFVKRASTLFPKIENPLQRYFLWNSHWVTVNRAHLLLSIMQLNSRKLQTKSYPFDLS